MTDAVKKLVRKNTQAVAKIAKLGGNYGLAAAVLTTSLDSAFLSNPHEFADTIDYVGGDWPLIQGFVTVSGTA